jgi:hypothetical protein
MSPDESSGEPIGGIAPGDDSPGAVPFGWIVPDRAVMFIFTGTLDTLFDISVAVFDVPELLAAAAMPSSNRAAIIKNFLSIYGHYSLMPIGVLQVFKVFNQFLET